MKHRSKLTLVGRIRTKIAVRRAVGRIQFHVDQAAAHKPVARDLPSRRRAAR